MWSFLGVHTLLTTVFKAACDYKRKLHGLNKRHVMVCFRTQIVIWSAGREYHQTQALFSPSHSATAFIYYLSSKLSLMITRWLPNHQTLLIGWNEGGQSFWTVSSLIKKENYAFHFHGEGETDQICGPTQAEHIEIRKPPQMQWWSWDREGGLMARVRLALGWGQTPVTGLGISTWLGPTCSQDHEEGFTAGWGISLQRVRSHFVVGVKFTEVRLCVSLSASWSLLLWLSFSGKTCHSNKCENMMNAWY